MRIAFITFEYPPFIIGGAGYYIESLTKELATLGHEIVVFTPEIYGHGTASTMNNVEIAYVKTNKNLPFKALQFWLNLPGAFNEKDNEKHFDITHYNGISYWFLRKLSKTRQVITIHHLVKDAIKSNKTSLITRLLDLHSENSMLLSMIEKRAMHSVDVVIADSDFTKKSIIDTYKIQQDKIYVIYLGICLEDSFFDSRELDEVKKLYKIPDKPIILFVGRVNDPRKGLDLLLKAFKKVLEKNDATLLIVGSGDDKNIINLAKTLNVSDNIILTGFVSDATLKKCYAICDVYVCPSRLEGFGLTILEAMAAGKPVVSTNAGSLPELLINTKNAVVDVNDIQEMARSINNFLSDNTHSKSVGVDNKNVLIGRFKWDNSAKQVETVYDKTKAKT